MMYEVKFGLIGFVVGTVAISAATFASNIDAPRSPISAETPAPIEHIALLPTAKPVIAETVVPARALAPAKPMSAWRRAYIAKHGHQPPTPAA
jgi:hypothetical protein